MPAEVQVRSPDGRTQTVTEKVFRQILAADGWVRDDGSPPAPAPVTHPAGGKPVYVDESGSTLPPARTDDEDAELFGDDPAAQAVGEGFEAFRTQTPPAPAWPARGETRPAPERAEPPA